jgi:hypothetical protein
MNSAANLEGDAAGESAVDKANKVLNKQQVSVVLCFGLVRECGRRGQQGAEQAAGALRACFC